MDTAIGGGDFLPGANGRPKAVGGTTELFQRAFIRLTVPFGSFAFDPSLGSHLHMLDVTESGADAKALAYAQEALKTLPQVKAEAAACKTNPSAVTVRLSAGGDQKEIEVKLNGSL